MKISELQPKQGKVDMVVEVAELGEARSFNKFGKEGRVLNAKVKDQAGDEITLSLWNDEIDKVTQGCFVKITNGYVGEYQGEKQLSAGKFGSLETVDGFETESSQDSP